jgi:hypothetical protein
MSDSLIAGRRHPAQLRDQCRARPVVQGPTRLHSALFERGHGLGHEPVVISHLRLQAGKLNHSVDYSGWWAAARPNFVPPLGWVGRGFANDLGVLRWLHLTHDHVLSHA